VTGQQSVVWGFYPGTHQVAGDFSDDVFSSGGLVGVGWPQTGNLKDLVSQHRPVADFVNVVRTEYQHNHDISAWVAEKREKWFRRSGGILYRFLCEARPGDIVVYANKRDQQVYIGRICNTDDGRYKYDNSQQNRFHRHFNHFRAVEWVKRVPYDDCSAPELSQVRTQSTFWRIGACPARFLI